MTNVEPLHTFNLDPSQQQAFVRFYRNLPERPISTVRFFNHGDFYTVHGQDASLAVETVVGSKVVKYMGVEPKLSYVVLGTSNFTRFLRELLLVKQYRVEVFVKTSQGRNNDWKVEYKGSPGNLSAFEDLIFKDDQAVVNTWVIAVNPLKNKTLAVGCVNTTDFKFSLSEFVDNDFYTELEALLAQINPKECLIPTGDSAELVALDRILSRNDKLVIKIKRSDFKADDVYQDLERLLYFKDGQQRNAQSLTETNQEDALGSLQAVLRHLNLTSDDTQFNQYRFSPLDVHGFVRLDGAAMSALNLFPKPEENGKSFKSVFEVFNCCVTAQGRRLLEQWFRKPLRDLNLISDRLEVVDCIINDAEMRSTLRTSCLTRTPDMLMLTKKLSNRKASLQDCYKIYQIVDSIPGMLATLTNGANKYIKGTLVDPLTDLNKDMEKFQNLIETTLDMDLVDRGEFLVKPTFDDELKELYEKKQNLEEKMQRALKSAAADLGMDAGKTIKLECTDQLGYFYKVTLKDEKLLRDSKRYETVATVKSGVRFTDKHLKELNEDYMDVCRSYENQQKMVVKQILDVAAGYADTLRNLNLCIAQVDVLTTFAHVATTAPGVFVKPTLLPEGSGVLRLTKARHPCVEKQDNVSYIPNNLDLRQGKTILNIITGPNMGGKSTYMRSVALCVFLAHVGSFVPCADAEISLVDCILTRVGSSDCELKGLSTFMMEMVETCGIVTPLCMYLLGKKPNLLSCCLSSDQVAALERNSTCYYLEAMAECGPKFQVGDLIARNSEQNAIFMNLVTRKRALTLKRLELEKLRQVEEEIDRKRTATAELKRQYDEALQDKKSQLIREVEREMKLNEELLKMQNLRQKLIAEEASNLIEYYEELDAITEQRRRHVQNHVDRLKMMDVVSDVPTVAPSSARVEEQINHPDVACSAEESPKEIEEDVKEKEEEALQSVTARSFAEGEGESVKDVEEEESKGVVNTNSEGDTKVSEVARNAAENFKIARRNRARVLSDVFGGTAVEMERKQESIKRSEDSKLSDLQRNRLKVLSSEYNLDYIHVPPRAAEMTSCQANKKRVMGTSDCFRALDEVNSNKIVNKEAKIPEEITVNNDNNCKDENANLNDVPRLTEENGNELNGEEMQEMLRVVEKNSINRQTANLKLDLSKLNDASRSTPEINNSAGSIFGKFLKSPNFELEKPVPMSLGSTPCYLDSVNLGSAPTTAATNFTDEGFDFAIVEQHRPTPEPILFNQKRENRILKERTHLSKRVPIKDAAIVSTRAIKTFIQHSVSVPVNTQMELVNNELLKYIFDDLQLLTHLNSLRSYFFLLDGEFGRNITEGLFEKLYDVNFPVDLINYRTLQHLVYSAIDSSIKRQRNSECLSFKINSLPDTFNLEDPDVLECLSLSYKVSWPLNVLLPSDTIGKYDEVFKFLLKLNRASWVLKKILQELKLLSKKCGTRDSFLVLSSQFQKLHQHRHIMTHFVQTLQNYVVGEVLQTSWDAFEKKLATVINIDEIYSLHVSYIKNILFTCLLNERSLPIRRLIMKIFTVVLKFFHYLRGAEWTFDADSCAFEHANFRKLDDIFRNFEELAAYFVKVARKVAKVGYQPHLIQLLDMLNVNDYYTNRTGFSRSQSNNSTLSSSNSSSM